MESMCPKKDEGQTPFLPLAWPAAPARESIRLRSNAPIHDSATVWHLSNRARPTPSSVSAMWPGPWGSDAVRPNAFSRRTASRSGCASRNPVSSGLGNCSRAATRPPPPSPSNAASPPRRTSRECSAADTACPRERGGGMQRSRGNLEVCPFHSGKAACGVCVAADLRSALLCLRGGSRIILRQRRIPHETNDIPRFRFGD